LTKQTSPLGLLQELQWSFICSIQHSKLTLKTSAGNLLIIAPPIGYNAGMPSNSTWVCFDCRTSIRRGSLSPKLPVCPTCHKACTHLGKKIAIPRKSDLKGWVALRESIFSWRAKYWETFYKKKIRRQHSLERQIAELTAKPPNDGRKKTIKQLREKLAEL